MHLEIHVRLDDIYVYPSAVVTIVTKKGSGFTKGFQKTLSPKPLGGWGGPIGGARARVNGEGGVKGAWKAPREKFTRAFPLQTLNPKLS